MPKGNNIGDTEKYIYNMVFFLDPKPKLDWFLKFITHINKMYREEQFDFKLGQFNGAIRSRIKYKRYLSHKIPINFDLTVGKPEGRPLSLYMAEDEFIKLGLKEKDPKYQGIDLSQVLPYQGKTVEQRTQELIFSHGGQNTDELTSRLHHEKFQLAPIFGEDYGPNQKPIMEFFLKNLYLLKRPI